MIKNFVIVDDDKVSNLVSKLVIQSLVEDSVVSAFEDPVAAVEIIRSRYSKERPQTVLLVDINMPNLNGWQFIDALSGNLSLECFVIYILSSSIDQEDRICADSHPLLTGFIEKPLTKVKLCALMDKI